MLNRRRFLQSVGLLAAGSAIAVSAENRQVSDPASSLYRRATVIDANLAAAFDAKSISAADIAALRASGLTAFKQSIAGSQGSHADAQAEIADLRAMIAAHPDLFMQIRQASDFAVAKRGRQIGIIFSFEASTVLEGRLERIDEFSALGVRVMQLFYNLPSPFGAGVLSPASAGGLTALGHDAVAHMNALGVSIDLSHANERTTADTVAASKRPVLITHAGCKAIYNHARNKSDIQLRMIADTGGVVGIYDLPYIDAGPAQQNLSMYLAHLKHALNVCGEDHVGIGSDTLLPSFDTSAKSLAGYRQEVLARKKAGIGAPGEERPPYVVGLNRADRSEIIARALLAQRVPERVVEKVLGANFARAFDATWKPLTA